MITYSLFLVCNPVLKWKLSLITVLTSCVSYEQKSLVAKVQRREMPDMGMLFLNIKVRRSHLISDSLNEVRLALYINGL